MFAVRPPEYFPRAATVALYLQADGVVLADTFQYSRQSYQNRTRLRNPGGWQWISIPLKGGQHGRPIDEARIDNRAYWARKHWRAFEYNYRSTPFFELYEAQFKPFFFETWPTVGAATCASILRTLKMLDVRIDVRRASELSGRPATLGAIVEAVEADALLVPEALVDVEEAGVPIRAFAFDEPEHHQNFDGFEPGMSVLDLLFNYGPEARHWLERGAVLAEPEEPR